MAVGCSTAAPQSEADQSALGIARFVVDDSPTSTTIRGLDATGVEIGRVDLVHGRFTLSPSFADESETPDVDGRKLEVTLEGQRVMHWETAGYTPTLHMPAPPRNQSELAAFLDDPHVKTVLARWQIGFESSALAGESAYDSGWLACHDSDTNCHDSQSCDGSTNCGSVQSRTINTCGNNAAALTGARIAQGSQFYMAQCCPAVSGVLNGNTPWFAIKTCPFSGNSSDCGSSSGACKSCPEYPVEADTCNVTLGVATEGQWPNITGYGYQLFYDYTVDPAGYDACIGNGDTGCDSASCCDAQSSCIENRCMLWN